MAAETKTVKTVDSEEVAVTKGRGRVRLRAVQAALGVAFLEAIPGGVEVARLIGIDPIEHSRRRMLNDISKDGGHDSIRYGFTAKASPRSAKQVTRGFLRIAKGALNGTRYAAILAKRGTLIVTAVCTVTSGIIAYRELTAVGFAALNDN